VTGGIDPAAAALLGLLVAANTKPFAPAALTGLLTAVGTLLVALGVKHVSGGEVSAVNAVVAMVMANVLRAHVSPVSGRRTETCSGRAHKAEVPPIGRAATARARKPNSAITAPKTTWATATQAARPTGNAVTCAPYMSPSGPPTASTTPAPIRAQATVCRPGTDTAASMPRPGSTSARTRRYARSVGSSGKSGVALRYGPSAQARSQEHSSAPPRRLVYQHYN
jgi:hypothetical protein